MNFTAEELAEMRRAREAVRPIVLTIRERRILAEALDAHDRLLATATLARAMGPMAIAAEREGLRSLLSKLSTLSPAEEPKS